MGIFGGGKDGRRAMRETLWPQRAFVGACIFGCVLGVWPPASAGEVVQPLSRVTAEEARRVVVAELRLRGVGEGELPRAEDVEVPLAVPARAGASLRVTSACWDAEAARVRFRLECRVTGACLPFLVYVRSAAHAQAASCQLGPRAQASGEARARVAAPDVHPGERARAVMVASGIRMTAAVICLDRGARGEIVRVRGGEGRIFRARVAGPALVETLGQ